MMTAKVVELSRRYAWSVSLSGLSALSFLRLASELHDVELDAFDAAVTHAVAGFRGRFDGPMLFLTEVGGGLGMLILCVASGLVLFGLRRLREALFVLACGVGALILSTSLKLAFHRARPEHAALYLLEVPNSFSFPSGHALGSTCVVGGLAVAVCVLLPTWLLRALAGALALAFVAGVACSRVYFGMHYPSDVLGGCFAGAAWVAALAGAFYPRMPPTLG